MQAEFQGFEGSQVVESMVESKYLERDVLTSGLDIHVLDATLRVRQLTLIKKPGNVL